MVKKSPLPSLVVPDVSVHEFIMEKMQEYGDKLAMVDYTRKRSITFREARKQIVQCASALYKRGLRKGQVVAICATNRLEYGLLLIAVSACGGISTTCNPLYREGEILQQFQLSKPAIVFCEAEVYPIIENIAADVPSLREVFTFGETAKSVSYDSLVLQDDGKDYPSSIKIYPKEDLFILPYSSGTTGLPKGVMLTHHNLIYQIVATSMCGFHARSSCFYMVVPMFHTFGYSMTLFHLASGSLNVFDSRFDVERLLQAVQEYKVNTFSAVPPMLILLTQYKHISRYDISSLRRVLVGAAPIAQTLIDKMEKLYRVTVIPCYGLTEMVPLSTTDPITKTAGSVGIIAPNVTVKIIDPDTGNELGPGEDGEILARGPQMLKGYLGNPEATARTIDSDGWFHTGDIGHYDDDGMLYIVDRLKELIKYKGFQVAPAELEALLLTHPGISDAAVIGISDHAAGELPKAFVVRNRSTLTERDIQKFVEGHVSNYKRLRGGVQFMESIPKSPSGKILRRELRKLPVKSSHL